MKLLVLAVLIFFGAAGVSQSNAFPQASFAVSLIGLAALGYILYGVLVKPIMWLYKKAFSKDKAVSSEDENKELRRQMSANDTKASLSTANHIDRPKENQEMEHLIPQDNLLVLSINKSVTEGAEIYNAARYAWKLNVDKARTADYVLAHQSGRVVGVFQVDKWLPADDAEFEGLGDADATRWGFVGRVAPSEVLLRYFNKQLPEGFIKRGAANPVRFILLDELEDDSATEGRDESKNTEQEGTAMLLMHGSSGRVDSDGDFCGVIELDVSGLGDEDSSVYIEGDVWAEIDGQTDETRVYESIQIAEGSVDIRSGYIKVTEGIDPSYSMKAALDVFKFGSPEIFEIVLPSKDSDLAIGMEEHGVKISDAKITFDEDGDCRISVVANGATPYAVSFGVSSGDDEPYLTQTISHEERSDFDDGLFDVNAGDKVKVAISVGTLVQQGAEFSGSGTAEVDERESGEAESDFFDDDEDDSLNVFVACVENGDYVDALEDDGIDASVELLSTRIDSFLTAVRENVDSEARLYLRDPNGNPKTIHSSDDLKTIWDLSSEDGLQTAISPDGLDHFQIVMVVKGNNHWDRGFLSVSGEEEVPPFYLWGMYSNFGDYAVQGYYEGDFDTGIANDPSDDSYYSGPDAMEQYGVYEDQFALATYGIDD